MESDMAKRTESKKRNGLKAKDSLMNKIFIVYMLLMFVSCVVLLAVFGLRFSNVYSSQAKAHMNDVTVAVAAAIIEMAVAAFNKRLAGKSLVDVHCATEHIVIDAHRLD